MREMCQTLQVRGTEPPSGEGRGRIEVVHQTSHPFEDARIRGRTRKQVLRRLHVVEQPHHRGRGVRIRASLLAMDGHGGRELGVRGEHPLPHLLEIDQTPFDPIHRSFEGAQSRPDHLIGQHEFASEFRVLAASTEEIRIHAQTDE